MDTHILVVEDDASLASWIADYLIDNNYSITVANRGDEAINMIEVDQPDLVILDVNLPAKNGFEVCKAVRKFYANPILMLTARGEENDEVLGLESGANDYLVKPVRPKALLARISSLLQKGKKNNNFIEYGNLRIDLESRSVLLNENIVPVSTNEFDMLVILANHPGQVLSREKLVENLRGIEYDGFNRSVDILVSRLRKKLQDDTTKPYRLKTVWGKGYLFAPDAW